MSVPMLEVLDLRAAYGRIEVLHEAWFRIEQRVVTGIDLLAVRRAQHFHRHGQPSGVFILLGERCRCGSAPAWIPQSPHGAGSSWLAPAFRGATLPVVMAYIFCAGLDLAKDFRCRLWCNTLWR